MTKDKILEVRAIENGTVIDHIPPESLFKIINIMRLDEDRHRMTFGTNLESKRIGKKAIIKITDRYCLPEEINRIAFVAPQARVNIIKNFKVVEKLSVEVPETITGYVRCINPKCITNNEPVSTAFDVIQGEGELALRCRYCEKITYQSQLEVIK